MWPLIAPSVSVGWSAPMWGSLLGHLWSGWVQELKNVRRNYKEEILKQTFITQWKFDYLLFIIFNTNVNARPMLFHISGQGGLFIILSISLSSMKSLRSPWVISCHGRSSFPIFLSKSLLVGAKLLQKSRITRTSYIRILFHTTFRQGQNNYPGWPHRMRDWPQIMGWEAS